MTIHESAEDYLEQILMVMERKGHVQKGVPFIRNTCTDHTGMGVPIDRNLQIRSSAIIIRQSYESLLRQAKDNNTKIKANNDN